MDLFRIFKKDQNKAVQRTGPASGRPTVRQPDVENDGRRQQENRCVAIQMPSQDLQGTLAIHHLQR